jgi:hypothetical protein
MPSPQTNPLCKQHAPDSQGQSRMSLLHLRVVAGEGTLQIPPLRFAPVGMTKLGAVAFLLVLLVAGRVLAP